MKINAQLPEGSKFTVLDERMNREASGHTRREWLCQCACGDTSWRHAQHVKTGRSLACRSCGNKVHGFSGMPEYKAWYAMRHRCLEPHSQNYAHYGGRGITVAPEWGSFEKFLEDMGKCPPGLTLERVNNDAGYSKDNCVWATAAQQAANRRGVRHISAFGKTQCVSAWAREYGLHVDTLAYRLKSGMSIEAALTKRTK